MYSSTILLISALFSAATASPLTARSICHPNFEGAALTVTGYSAYGATSWAATPVVGAVTPVVGELANGSTAPSKFFFQQNGDDPDVTYTVKTVANVNFAVELTATGGVVTHNVDWSGSNVNQKWRVECTTCATDISQKQGVVASGCAISSAFPATNGFCVRMSRPGRELELAICPSEGNGNFYFSV
ncbi:uncharacterized protein EV420DRAFT_1768539 [Desarmillaria tabescens]|uniref:Ricin B lectin domain-containing protein n=1 Tax=Armillaria tabescens TaxID=1929756 RepID=A0AA39MS05_ARMTA|nr:uncharacterized protein EV420DRAFT_1768539 [Desarmillaria tabescens]KAK0443690.1 hypothetical protein EV420DRAFT_1768539 [Desarmillaria tabescens]